MLVPRADIRRNMYGTAKSLAEHVMIWVAQGLCSGLQLDVIKLELLCRLDGHDTGGRSARGQPL
jgi:hypothetical protein